jgi:hypothetical protein
MVGHYPLFPGLFPVFSLLMLLVYCTVHGCIVPNHVQTSPFDLVSSTTVPVFETTKVLWPTHSPFHPARFERVHLHATSFCSSSRSHNKYSKSNRLWMHRLPASPTGDLLFPMISSFENLENPLRLSLIDRSVSVSGLYPTTHPLPCGACTTLCPLPPDHVGQLRSSRSGILTLTPTESVD